MIFLDNDLNQDPFGNPIHHPLHNLFSPEELTSLHNDLLEDVINERIPSSDGVDFYFLFSFINDKMSDDFEIIEHDFIKHCAHKLTTFSEVGWYDTEGFEYSNSGSSIGQRIIRLIYNGAKLRDDYCLTLIITLYKTYHRNEFQKLKRFSSISLEEIFSLSEDVDGNSSLFTAGRIIGMCLFLGISLNQDVYDFFHFLSAKKKQPKSILFPEIKPFSIDGDVFDEANDVVDKWFSMTNDTKENPQEVLSNPCNQDKKFTEACLRLRGYSPKFIERNSFERANPSPKQKAIKILSILKTLYPTEEFTQEEVWNYISIYDSIDSLCNIADTLKNVVDMLSGDQITPIATSDSLFKPDSIYQVKTSDPPTPAPAVIINKSDDIPISNNELLQEISTLRSKLSNKEHEINYLRGKCQTSEQNNQELSSLVRKYESERDELIALRNFAYESFYASTYEASDDVDNYLPLLQEYRVAIIGGHVGWINKLKSLLPHWTYILPDSYRTIDANILENKDRVYFFTDYLNHASYRKFISIIRERSLPFGYLNNNNLDMVLMRVAKDLSIL
jgi:hypothetical protein